MNIKSVFFVAMAGLICASAGAQVVDPGMNWSGSSGSYAGTTCGSFTCTPFQTAVSVGEVVTLQVRGTYNRAYAIGISGSASQCLAIPGVQHSLVLDFPITLALTGVFVDGDPALVCPGGRAIFNFAFPFMPPGTAFSIQAAAELPNGGLSFTAAITVTVL